MTKSEDKIKDWLGSDYDYKDIYDKDEFDARIKKIENSIPEKDKKGNVISDDKKKQVGNIIESLSNREIKPQIEYIENTKENISKARSIDDLNRISINKTNFQDINAENKLKSYLGSRKQFFEEKVFGRQENLEAIKSVEDLAKYGYTKRVGLSTLAGKSSVFYGVPKDVIEREYERMVREGIIVEK